VIDVAIWITWCVRSFLSNQFCSTGWFLTSMLMEWGYATVSIIWWGCILRFKFMLKLRDEKVFCPNSPFPLLGLYSLGSWVGCGGVIRIECTHVGMNIPGGCTIVPVPLEADWGVVWVESRDWVRLCELPCWLVVHYSCICLTSDFGTGVTLEKCNVQSEESITAHGVPGWVVASLQNWAS